MIKEILKSQTLVMDGALGTELEDMVPKDSKFQPRYHSLWSGTVLLNQPDLVYEVHRKYLEEGCDIILTSSYQLSFQGLEDQLGASLEKAQEIWDKSVAVADKAIRDYSISHHRNIYLFGSIGPYGAYLHNGAEYTGQYGDISQEELVEHHKDLVSYFIKDDRVDAIAFETIPNLTELKAVIQIMTQELRNNSCKEFYLSFNFQDLDHLSDGHQMKELLEYLNDDNVIKPLGDFFIGIGINCVSHDKICGIIDTINVYNTNKFALIVYPNLGFEFGKVTDSYHSFRNIDVWSQSVKKWLSKPNVRIIGGCCSTGPEEIRVLTRFVHS
ncbi:uncharacterized protein PRCAT00003035001 [Priceomyces carsonii]|uniref:uncharacterized protein n=1 Tax=Priceomyces carsonii TaxID=28549 RepID=UPI002ED7D6CB|nr:unnamed protein product [Priceomyces carsonii]